MTTHEAAATQTSDVDAAAAPSDLKRTALVFFSGLGDWAFDTKPAHVVAQAVEIELERSTESSRQFTSSSAIRLETVSRPGSARPRTLEMATVSERLGTSEQPIVDVYFFNTGAELTDRFENSSFFTKTIAYPIAYGWSYVVTTAKRVVMRVLRSTPGLKTKVMPKSKEWSNPMGVRRTLQNIWALLLQLSIVLYSLIAAGTLAAVWVEDVGTTVTRTLATITAALTAAGFAKFGKVQNLPASIAALSARHMASKDYVEGSQMRSDMFGILADILDHIGEKKRGYEQTIVVGYSFGAIVALDSIFPKDGSTASRGIDEIDLLVTIGCPADFIRKQVPDYFWGRGKRKKKQRLPWINVYRPLDVLSSNFRMDQSTTEKAEFGIRPKGWQPPVPDPVDPNVEVKDPIVPRNAVYGMPGSMRYGFGRALALEGLRLHAKYFRPIRKGAETPLRAVVTAAFTPAAPGPPAADPGTG